MTPYQHELLQKAIEAMTLNFERGTPDGDALAKRVSLQAMEDDPNWEVHTLVGMSSLVTILLVKIEALTGQAPVKTLQAIAQKYRPAE